MGTYLILIIPVLVLSMFVQWRFRNKFSKYAEMQLNSGLSGKEVAEKMLHDNGIFNVNVKGAYNALFAVIPKMKANGGGAILNLASIAAWVGNVTKSAFE